MRKILYAIIALALGANIVLANEFFTASGVPSTGSALNSATMRGEFSSIEDGFDKMPTLTGNGNKVVTVNSGGTALTATAATALTGMVIGTNVQAWDADLDGVAALAATAGMLSRTGAGAFVARTITGTASEIDVANGSGASAAPTLSLPSTLVLTGKTVTADTQAVGDNSTKLATTAFVERSVPTGTILDFAGTSAPTGFLAADGSAVSRSTYAALFTAIGTTWGVGDGATTFNLPNFQRRVTVGSGGTGTGTLGNAVGNVGGAETHTLSQAETPVKSHAHEQQGSFDSGTQSSFHVHPQESTTVRNAGSGAARSSGTNIPYGPGGQTGIETSTHTHLVTISGNTTAASDATASAHNNLQPSIVVLKIIKY